MGRLTLRRTEYWGRCCAQARRGSDWQALCASQLIRFTALFASHLTVRYVCLFVAPLLTLDLVLRRRSVDAVDIQGRPDRIASGDSMQSLPRQVHCSYVSFCEPECRTCSLVIVFTDASGAARTTQATIMALADGAKHASSIRIGSVAA